MKKLSIILFWVIVSFACENKKMKLVEQTDVKQQGSIIEVSDEPYPQAAYEKITYFSLAPAAYDYILPEIEQQGYVKGIASSGLTFIDSTGKPIHDQYLAFDLDSIQAKELSTILRPAPMPADSIIMSTACVPVYREAFIFYKKVNQPIGILHVCLNCSQTEFYPAAEYMVNFDQYDRFSELYQFVKKLKSKQR